MGNLLHSKKIAADHAEFLEQLKVATNAFISAAGTDGAQRNVYKSATAAHTVFRAFSVKDGDRLLLAAAGIARRVAILSVLRQLSLLRVELRRMIELVCWYVYFCDHPAEKSLFLSDPGRLFDDHREDPLAAGAHGPPIFYRAYLKSLMKRDPSKIGSVAADALALSYSELSTSVHPAQGAVQPSGTLAISSDHYSVAIAEKMRMEIEAVHRNAIIVVTVADTRLISSLDAINREWFDWLIGKDLAKIVRTPDFGILRPWT